MKLSVVNELASLLSGIKINRIPDKNVKATLVYDYIFLRKFAKEADERRKDLIEKFQADWMDELMEVNNLRNNGNPIVGHDGYLEAESDANKAIQSIFESEVDVNLRPVKLDDFLSSFGEEDLTFEQIAFMQENGILE